MTTRRIPVSRRSPSRAGFTLMEIIIVLAILSVLVALVLPNFLGAQQDANKKTAKLAVDGVEKAVKIYAGQHDGTFPTSIDALLSNQNNDPHWAGPYLEKGQLPTDPWGQPIQYQYPGSHQNGNDFPDIWSNGKDKSSGTQDDIGNWKQ